MCRHSQDWCETNLALREILFSAIRHSDVELNPAVMDLSKGAPITILWAHRQLLEASADQNYVSLLVFSFSSKITFRKKDEEINTDINLY